MKTFSKICSFTLAATISSQAQTSLQLLHASDLEGGVEAISDAPNFAAVVDALEADAAASNIPSLLLSAGDNYIPGPFFSAAGDRDLRTPLQEAYSDLFGVPLTNVREGVGRVDITVMNILGFDASAVGNHEFDAGTSTFASIIRPDIRGGGLGDVRWLGAQFPYLTSNLDFSAEGSLSGAFTDQILTSDAFRSEPSDLAAAAAAPKLAEATIIEKDGERYGVIGATTPLVETISSTGDVVVEDPGAGSNEMADLAAIIQPVIDAVIAEGVNKVILVTHLQQIALEEELVPLLSGVDIAIAGGSDTLLADATDVLRPGDVADRSYPIVTTNADSEPALIVSTDGQYSYVGRLVVDFDASGVVIPASVDETESGAYLTTDDGVAALWGATDPFAPGSKARSVKDLADAVETIVTTKDGIVYGSSRVFLEGRRASVRTEETNLGNLTADANLAAAQAFDPAAVISFKNGGGIRSEIGSIDGLTGEEGPNLANPISGKAAGEISQLDIENSLRFNNELTLVTLSAADVLAVLEHAVSATAEGATPGQFPQIGGLAFSFDPLLPAGERVQTVALKNSINETTEMLVENGAIVGDSEREFRVVTLNFLAGGGDGYPFQTLGTDIVDTGLGEQEALADYLTANFSIEPFSMKDTAIGQDARIQNLDYRSDSTAFPMTAPEGSLSLTVAGRYETGIFDAGAAEIIAFDPESKRIFLVNANDATVDILDISDPSAPALAGSIDIQQVLGRPGLKLSPNSVAIADGLVAVAVARNTDDDAERPLRGLVGFFDIDGLYLTKTMVGCLPDMVAFTPNKRKLVVANEGEPNDDYTIDPEGSVSVISTSYLAWQLKYRDYLQRGRWGRFFRFYPPYARTANFRRYNRRKEQLVDAGVRIYGPGASVAQDLEPEFVAISDDSRTAYVTLQENNAVAFVDINRARVFAIEPLGLKDFSQSGFDASNKDDSVNIQPWPVFGMYQPDSLAQFEIDGTRYLITSNEGDARDYDTFSEEVRLADLTLDPDAFPDFELLQSSDALGRLRVTSENGDFDDDGDLDQIFGYGGRSFSIWEARRRSLELVYDSGSDIENITASLIPADFNSTNDENGSFDSRSDDKGPEPEGVVVGEIDGRTYAFIGLERVGGIMVYDVTNPEAPVYLQYVISRDFFGDAEEGTAGDLGPEGLTFVSATDSPNEKALLLVANEVSGSVTVLEIE